MNRNKQQGFTLIELIMVIVILGILAATALPKFADLGKEARIAALEGAHGAMNATIAITHAKSLLSASPSTDIDLEGVTGIKMAFGYPTAAADGIDKTISLTGDLSIASGVISISGATAAATCKITYTAAANASTPASAAIVTGGC